MDDTAVKKLIEIRTKLISEFSSLRDYKNNQNAIMKEVEAARILHETITSLDDVLSKYVEFSSNTNSKSS